MREVLIGFDPAWTDNPRNPGAITIQRFEDGVVSDFVPPCLATFKQAQVMVAEQAASADLLLVAIDQPTIVPNLEGFRPVEKVAMSIVNALKGGVQPGRRGGSGAAMFGDDAPIWRFLDRLDAVQDPERARTADRGRFAMEVFPALALPSLVPAIWDRKRAAKYNPDVRRMFLLTDWHLVCEGLAGTAERLGLMAVSDWALAQRALGTPRKADQDRLDAALCLVIARHWRHAPRGESIVLGDAVQGYIVTPATATVRQVLAASASRRGVPIDGWRSDEAGVSIRHGGG